MEDGVVAIANTDYFELDSREVGGKFGVWVTRPVGYDAKRAGGYPVLYVVDGNLTAALLAPYLEWFAYDAIHPLEPFVAVTVGYPGTEAANWMTLRNRDLLPPGEPVSQSTQASIKEGDFLPEDERDPYLEMLSDGHADRFLAFLETELAPRVEADYNVRKGEAALWGYSYGGLFALYAIFKQSGLFNWIGASSPGVMTDESQIFALERQAKLGGGVSAVKLHLTLNEAELAGGAWIYRDLAIQFARFVDLLHRDELPGLEFKASILSGESHATGWTQAFLSFARACYGRCGWARPAGAAEPVHMIIRL